MSGSLLRPVFAALPAGGEYIGLRALMAATGLPRVKVSAACSKLVARGLAVRRAPGVFRLTPAGIGARSVNAVHFRCGPARPRTAVRKPPPGSLRGRIWRAFRGVRRATLPELLEIAARGAERAPESNARKYLQALCRAGIAVALRRRAVLPNGGGHIRYMLVRDPGPEAPVWSAARRGLFDPNSRAFIPDAALGRVGGRAAGAAP